MKNVTTAGPLKKSTTNPPAPLLAEGHPRGKTPPPARPNTPLGTNRHVAVDEAKPISGNNKGSIFAAPRKDGGMSPAECGYTKPGKM